MAAPTGAGILIASSFLTTGLKTALNKNAKTIGTRKSRPKYKPATVPNTANITSDTVRAVKFLPGSGSSFCSCVTDASLETIGYIGDVKMHRAMKHLIAFTFIVLVAQSAQAA